MGYANMALGAGLCMGPVIASIVYRYLSYVGTFYFFTAYIFLIGMGAVWIIPQRVNHTLTEPGSNVKIGYTRFLCNRQCIMSLVTAFFAILCLVYLDPILSVQLAAIGVPESNVGFAFAMLGGAYTISSPIAGLICQKLPRKIVI